MSAQIAGALASALFFMGMWPMLAKLYATRDVDSYSGWQLGICVAGNLIYWWYVLSLPRGPIYFLQVINTIVSLIMFGAYLRYRKRL